VANGSTNKEIARDLDISEKSVKHYMTTIMQKLHVLNRVEAASILLQASERSAQ
jgi:DNA-binding NarL/FixJ family response regulator